VVLQCNNYEVIDLGVMVPADRILDAAVEHRAHAIGLSGLITPSLDEMVFVAAEMQRRGMDIPLLIGGATTSKTHTAVKIAPAYPAGATTYVLDASRAVGVVSQLLSPDTAQSTRAETEAEYARVREQFARGQDKRPRTAIAEARANRIPIDWATYTPPKPSFLGLKTFDAFDLQTLADTIDWSPFFQSWDLVGRYPDILQDDVVGEAARALWADAQPLLARIIAEKRFTARGVVGFWPAQSVGDDIALYADETREVEIGRLHTLRQQMDKTGGRANAALSDFIAPLGGPADYVGGFAVTAGHGEAEFARSFREAGDDYSAIIVAALADRLAEAFAERLHLEVRRTYWGYAPDEALSLEDLLAEKYQGIRPAAGYPAQPDHTEKATLFRLLDATAQTGITLTESFAMSPAAAVSGLYFSHPQAHYFGVGRIDRDQVQDYAARKGWTMAEAERWLAPILAY